MGTIIWYAMLIYATWVTMKWRKAESKIWKRRRPT
jgi:hypothetical protein